MMGGLSPSHPPIRFAYGCDSLAEALHTQSFQQQLYKRECQRGRCQEYTQSGPTFSGDISHQERGLVQVNHGNLSARKKHDLSISIDDS